MKYSVIMATFNRSQILEGALQSMVAQSIGPSSYEVIVVDNRSTDDTKEVVDKFVRKYPEIFRYIFEPRPGLCVARNAGIRASRYEVMVFMDDDAVAEPGWLAALNELFEDEENIGAGGGPIRVEWRGEKPPWYFPEFDVFVNGVLDHGDKRIELHYPRTLYGSNLAVKKSVFREIGLFSENLGRKGKGLMAYEELELISRVGKAGYRIMYHPDAAVRHLALPHRNSLAYFRRHAYFSGKSQKAFESELGRPGRNLFRMPYFLIRTAIAYGAKHRGDYVKQRELIFWLGYWVYGLRTMFSAVRLETPPRLEKQESGDL